ncbi:MAG: flagellar biosynthetic protein FliO, partial [Alphaproteobacteria bacterium]|nr:flagellar biosynthetic protein FliO [Alphaproteobacteria bacterium]
KKLGLAAQTPVIRGNNRRLRLVESLPLDARRRLVLLECDKIQHLVILSASGETVIESNIPARPSVDESAKADDAP